MQYIFAASVLLAVYCTLGQSQNLSVFHIQPCNGTFNQTVSRFKSDVYAVTPNYSLCVFNGAQTSDKKIGLRIVSWAKVDTTGNEAREDSVAFVSRQAASGGVSSWSIPLQPDGFDHQYFDQVNRTMCPCTAQEDTGDTSSLFYLDVFSSSMEEMEYSISIEIVPDYFIELDKSISTIVDASSPQIHYFKFPNDSSTVTVEASTENNTCAFVSIQNTTCPVNDLLRNAMSRGIYQTMNKSAYLTVQAEDVIEREFALVLITTSYSHCHYHPPLSYDEYRQNITVVIKNQEPISRYIFAILFPIFLFFINMILVCICVCCLPRVYCTRTKCICCIWKIIKDEESSSSSSSSSSSPGMPYGSTNHSPETVSKKSQDRSKTGSSESTALLVVMGLNRDEMLPLMTKENYKKLDDQDRVYSWNTITVGIFYALPAFQLVLSEQQILKTGGNQDRCYYNFKCTHPLGVLTAFNNQWSNVGYVLLGVLFLSIICIKKIRYKRNIRYKKITRNDSDCEVMDNPGIPQFFGIYQAMGIALIMEGFMSAFYHICPTGANFQFDTAFMFILGGLFLLKLLQNRHPDINANAFVAFFSFAVIIFMTLIGIYLDPHNPIAVRIPFYFIVIIIVFIFFFSFYWFYDWIPSHTTTVAAVPTSSGCGLRWDQLKNLFGWLKHKCRFIKFVLVPLANILIMVVAISVQEVDIATGILLFFVVNLVVFLLFYFFQKFYYREPITVLPLFLMVIVLFLWGAAFYFFFKHTSDWTLTPANSRTWNHECVLFCFYDYHDIWHFLSAHALFYSFLFLLTLDDGLVNTKSKSEDIPIF